MIEDQLPTPYNNAAIAPSWQKYFELLQQEMEGDEESPQPVQIPGLGDITPNEENIRKAAQLYQQMIQPSQAEQVLGQQIQRGLSLDPTRDFLNPQLQRVYGKGLKMPTEPGVEAEPSTKQRLVRGLKNTAFALPAMLGLPVLAPLIKTEEKARQRAEKQYNLSKQDTAQLLQEQGRQLQEKRQQASTQMQLLKPLMEAPLKQAEAKRRLQKDKDQARKDMLNLAVRLSDQDLKAFGENFKQQMQVNEFQLAQKKDKRAQTKFEGELTTSLNDVADMKASKALGKPVDQLTPQERAGYRLQEHVDYHNKIRPASTATNVQVFSPKPGMYLVKDPASRTGVKLVQGDSIITRNKITGQPTRTIIGPEGQPIQARYIGGESSDETKEFRNFDRALALGDRYIGSLTDYFFASPNAAKLYGGVGGRTRELVAQFSSKFPGAAALAEIYQTNMGLQHVQTMYKGRPNIFVVEKVMQALGTPLDEREAALYKGLSNKLILELWFHDRFVEGKGDDPREYDQSLPEKMNDAMANYLKAWRGWKPGMARPEIPTVKAIADGTYSPILESDEARKYREEVRKKLGGR